MSANVIQIVAEPYHILLVQLKGHLLKCATNYKTVILGIRMHGSAPRLCHQARSLGRRLSLICVLACLTAACGRLPASPSSTEEAIAKLSTNLAYCVDQVNRYRTSVGLTPLSRSADLEAFAAQAAENDGRAHKAHHWFGMTGGGGMATAENEILWWKGFGVQSVIEQGLRQMWQAGPRGEHYDIMVGSFSQIGCGIFVNGSEVTVAQDFR